MGHVERHGGTSVTCICAITFNNNAPVFQNVQATVWVNCAVLG